MLNLIQAVETAAERHPNRTAIVSGGRRMTYAELMDEVRRLAAGLQDHGIRPGDRVALACPNITAFPVAYLAILTAGAAVVPVSLLLKRNEIAYMLDHAEVVAFLCFEGTEAMPIGAEGRAGLDRVPSCRLFAWITSSGEPRGDGLPVLGELMAERAADTIQRSAEDTAVVVYTSGTTGRPKGAELTHANLLFHVLVIPKTSGWGDDEVLLCVLPLFHVYGQVCQMVAGLGAGATLVLVPRFDAATVLARIAEEGATRFSGVPTMYWALLNHPLPEGSVNPMANLRGANSGGASLPVEILTRFEEKFAVSIQEGYGLSETSPAATTHHHGWPRKPGTVGTPLWGVRVAIMDDAGTLLPSGERGEVVIRGHGVMKGYLKDPEATAEAFRGGWFHSGDIGVIDGDGYLAIVDRKKEMIIRNGMNVYPREIEEVLITHPAVSLVAVVGTPHEEHGQEIKAFVVPRAGAELEPEALIAWAKERMASYKYPRAVELRDALPMTASGKIKKTELTG
ncbi:MAG: long-chain fatty acid--CoA ligase [Alphaproteobacteria bacterium]|nr:long-chain fatty acid--CoA ligase [Alphaproteobacteria bacterium]